MKTYFFRVALLVLFFIGSINYSQGHHTKADGGGIVLIAIAKQGTALAFSVPDEYIVGNQSLTIPMEIAIYQEGKKEAILAATSMSNQLNLDNLILDGGQYRLTVKIGEYYDSQSFTYK